MEDSPSPVYGAALLMRFGSDPIRGSNPRSSAEPCSRAFGPLPSSWYLPGGRPPGAPRCGLWPETGGGGAGGGGWPFVVWGDQSLWVERAGVALGRDGLLTGEGGD